MRWVMYATVAQLVDAPDLKFGEGLILMGVRIPPVARWA